MRNFALQAAGMLAILTALAHGFIAEWRIFPKVRIEPAGMRGLLRMVWQASTIDWIAMGILLIALPSFGTGDMRRIVIALAVVIYGYAAIGNAIATRGRHIGWVLMTGVVALALTGL